MKGQAILRLQPSKLNSACVNYTWMMRRLKNAIAIPYSYQQLSVVTWSDMAALLMKAWPSLHRILQIGKSIDNKGKWLNNYINLSYFSWITSFIVFMMDFTYADMKFSIFSQNHRGGLFWSPSVVPQIWSPKCPKLAKWSSPASLITWYIFLCHTSVLWVWHIKSLVVITRKLNNMVYIPIPHIRLVSMAYQELSGHHPQA